MTGTITRIALACAALLSGGLARADTSSTPISAPASPSLDTERLAVARRIVAIVLPQDRREAIIESFETDVTREMQDQMLLRFRTNDPGLLAIIATFTSKIPGFVNKSMATVLPFVSEAMAHAYARQYTREELSEILDFCQTTVGKNLLGQAGDIWKSQEVENALYSQKRDLEGRQVPLMNDFISSVVTYLNTHPDVAKKINQPIGN